MTRQTALSSVLTLVLEHISGRPPQKLSTAARTLTTSARTQRARNVLAHYRPVPSQPLGSGGAESSTGSQNLSDDFITTSTHPVGTSFQTVPPPSAPAAQDGAQVENPVPAMVASKGSSMKATRVDPKAGPADGVEDGPSASTLEPAQRRKEMAVQGVAIPPKPIPPGEEDCCMSGCVHCIYTIYADDLETYTEALSSARQALVRANIPAGEWPEEVRGASDSAGVEEVGKRVEEGVDPSMAAFLALEAKMRKKQGGQ